MNEFSVQHQSNERPGSCLGLDDLLSLLGRPAPALPSAAGHALTLFLPAVGRPAQSETRRSGVSRPPQRTGGRILVMDDDENLRALTGGMIESLGYRCDLATNGAEAVQLFQRSLKGSVPYTAVILDLNIIGGMGGDETFRLLRDLDPSVRAIMTSGHDNDEFRRRYLDLGFCAYVTKPYRVGDLDRSLRLALAR